MNSRTNHIGRPRSSELHSKKGQNNLWRLNTIAGSVIVLEEIEREVDRKENEHWGNE